MEGKIITVDEINVVGIGWTGPYSDGAKVGQLWPEFLKRIGEIKNIVNPGTFVCPKHDRASEFNYYIGVEVSKIEDVPSGMVGFTVPQQRYAAFTHRGPMSKVVNTYYKMFDWIKENGCEKHPSALDLEVYDNRYNPVVNEPDREENEYDIYLSII